MFWKKQAKKRCNPLVKLAVFATAALSGVALLKKGKEMAMCKMKKMIKAIKCSCNMKIKD